MSLLTNTRIDAQHMRVYEWAAPNWLISLSIKCDHGSGNALIGAHPSARAVVDDFGTLVIVREWL